MSSSDRPIDFSRFTGIHAENEETVRQQLPHMHLRPQPEIERNPTWFQRKQELEGRSEWSGGRMGGGTWSGRSR
jgi:hypothetical protein